MDVSGVLFHSLEVIDENTSLLLNLGPKLQIDSRRKLFHLCKTLVTSVGHSLSNMGYHALLR